MADLMGTLVRLKRETLEAVRELRPAPVERNNLLDEITRMGVRNAELQKELSRYKEADRVNSKHESEMEAELERFRLREYSVEQLVLAAETAAKMLAPNDALFMSDRISAVRDFKVTDV